jgi:hypothetical protein
MFPGAAMIWLRWYVGTVNDPKWRIVAQRASARPGDCVAVWAWLLEIAKESAGDVTRADPAECAVVLGFKTVTVQAILDAMTERGLICGGQIANWSKRQPKREDGSAERAKAWRDANKGPRLVVDAGSDEADHGPFPVTAIRYTAFGEIARREGRNIDVEVLATAFRAWCRSKGVPLDDPGITNRFIAFCGKHRTGRVGT